MLELYCFVKCYLSLLTVLKESSCHLVSMGGELHRKNYTFQMNQKKGRGKFRSLFLSLFIFAYSMVKELSSGCLWTTAGLSAAAFPWFLWADKENIQSQALFVCHSY